MLTAQNNTLIHSTKKTAANNAELTVKHDTVVCN